MKKILALKNTNPTKQLLSDPLCLLFILWTSSSLALKATLGTDTYLNSKPLAPLLDPIGITKPADQALIGVLIKAYLLLYTINKVLSMLNTRT